MHSYNINDINNVINTTNIILFDVRKQHIFASSPFRFHISMVIMNKIMIIVMIIVMIIITLKIIILLRLITELLMILD